MNNILVRSLSGALFIVIVIGSFLLGESYTGLVLGIFMFLGLVEFYRLFSRTKLAQPFAAVGIIAASAIYILVVGNQLGWWRLNIFAIFVPFVFLVLISVLTSKKDNPLFDVALTYLGWIYVLIPFLIMFQLYNYPAISSSWCLIVGMFLIVWSNDTFAYLFGRFFGKHKLFERISPKKTWEGTIGGFTFALIAGLIYAYFTTEDYSFWVIGAALISITGVIGDLIESKMKRSVNVKDSGNIMPGHGGILDRFDAVIFATPFFYIWCILFL